MAEWGERQQDGSVIVFNDEGRPPRQESWEQNQGLPAGGGSPAGMTVPGGSAPTTGQPTAAGETTYEMPDGRSYTIAQMRAALAAHDSRWVSAEPYQVVTEYQKLKNIAMGRADGSSAGAGGGAGGGGGGGGGINALLNAAALDNTTRLNLLIQQAAQQYALAVTAEERQQAYLDLQRWTTELGKVQQQQGQYTDMAKTILSAATQLGSRPDDYQRFNQVVSGGRDIFDVMSGKAAPGAAFGGPAGRIRPGSVEDLLGRLGLQYPQTPATPGGVQVGAQNPTVTPGQPGGGAGGAAPGSAERPSLDAMKSGLRTAGWSGNWDDPEAVASAWWGANPARQGTPRPARWW